MKNIIICLTISCLVIMTITIKADHLQEQDQSERFFDIFNSLLAMQDMSPSRQVKNCFTVEEKDRLISTMSKMLQTGALGSMSQLQHFPQYFINSSHTYFSSQTLNCFFLSRDFNLYFSRYNTQIKDISTTWYNKMTTNYLKIHMQFGLINAQLGMKKDIEVATNLDVLLGMVLGYRGDVKEKEWEKSVKNLEKYNGDYYGITVSNGVIGAVSSKKPLSVSTTVLAGSYDIFGRGRVDNIVQTFPAMQIQIDYGYDITSSGYYNYQQSLHFDQGQFFGAFSSDYCSVQYSYYALKNLPFAFYTKVDLIAHRTQQITLKIKHQAPQYLNNIQKSYQSIDSHQRFDILHTKATSKTGKLDLVIASSYILGDNIKADIFHQDWDSGLHFIKLKLNVTKGSHYNFGIVSCLISSSHHQDPQNQAIRIIQRALSIGQKTLISKHQSLWQQMWTNDIIIDGNVDDQKNVRLMLYHCYAFINDWKSYGISPMGLSGLGYNGHVFWDMDLWIYPAILALKPSLAKTLIEYRYQRLEEAKNNAFINGYQGAMFPWESSSVGVEETPVWALTGPLEHHISGCVAFAAWNYYCVTQDLQWLRNKGYAIIKSVADFWISRVELGNDGYYHINNVVAADQWAQNVDDNAFTNAIAIKSLQIANIAAAKLSLPQNPTYTQIASKIIILKLSNGVTKQHKTYNGQNIKQADVNLLSFPLKIVNTVEQIQKDLTYYQSRIPDRGTPAMTYSIFTILYSRLQNPDSSYKYFKESFEQNLKPPFNAFAQTKGGTNPYFMTGAGGVLQSLIYGYGGYEITDNGLVKIATKIPKQWKSVTIKGALKSQYLPQIDDLIAI